MKNILVVDVAASISGGAAILKQFFDYVCKHGQDNNWLFVTSVLKYDIPEDAKGFVQIKSFPEIKKSPINRIIWETKDLGKIIPKFKPDVVLSLQNNTVNIKGVKQFVYMHQSLPFQDMIRFSFLKKSEFTSAFQQRFMGFFIKKSLKKADGVIVQTNWIRDGVVRKTKIDPNKVIVSPPSVAVSEVEKKDFNLGEIYNIEKPVLFFPAVPTPYKNHLRLLEALRILKNKGIDCRLLLTADSSSEYGKQVFGKANEYNLDVVSVGYLSRKDLYEYMVNSVLVFPSFIETVGLPLIEAQSFGIPIAVSDCAYAREVCDGYDRVFYFDYTNPESIAEKIEQAIKLQKPQFEDVIKMNVPERFVDSITWKKVVEFIDENT